MKEMSHSAFFSEQNNSNLCILSFSSIFPRLMTFLIYFNLLSNAVPQNRHSIPDGSILEEANKWDSVSCQNMTFCWSYLKLVSIHAICLDAVSQEETPYLWKQQIVSSLNVKSNLAIPAFAHSQQLVRSVGPFTETSRYPVSYTVS